MHIDRPARKVPSHGLPESVADDYRKILAFAASAGDTIPEGDALEVIRSICTARLHGDERAAAIARHGERVLEARRG